MGAALGWAPRNCPQLGQTDSRPGGTTHMLGIATGC